MRGRSRSTSGSTKYLSTLAMAFALVMGIVCFYSCGKPEEPKPTPTPVNPVNPDPPTPPEDKDTKAPEITLKLTELNVYGGKVVTIEVGKLSIGETEVASWTDDKSAADKCTVALSFTEAGTKAATEATTNAEAATDNESDTKADTKAATTIKSGDTLDKAGTLTLAVTDEAGNSASKDITLTEDNSAPEVKVLKESVDVYGGKAVTAKDNTLSIGDDAVLQWTDDHGDECSLTLSLDGAEVSIGGEVCKAGTLKVTVTDSKGLGTEASITLTDQIVFGMENLKNLDLQIDKEVNLIGGLSFYEGWSLANVEIETNGSRTEIFDPEHYIPAAAGSIYVIITVTDGAKTAEFKSDALSVKPMQYAAVQFEKADATIYKKREDQKATLVLDGRYKERHTFYENVGLVEGNTIDEILDKIGGTERETALSRLYYCDANEIAQNGNPGTDGLRQGIGWNWETEGDGHCTSRLNIIKSNKEFPGIAQSLKNKMLCAFERKDILQEAKSHPNNTYVVGNAVSGSGDRRTRNEIKDNRHIQAIKELAKLKNVIICNAIPDNRGEGSNIFAEEGYETDKYVCTYNDRSPKGDRILHTGGCGDNNIFQTIDGKSTRTAIRLGEDPAIVMPSTYPVSLKDGTDFVDSWSPSSYSTVESFITKIWTQNPNLSADQVVQVVNNHLVDVPVYWNGQLFTEMKAKTLDFLGILKDLHLPQLPAQISSSQASALPSSPTGLYVFYEGKGVMGLRNGSLVPTTADNFPDTQSILDAARSGGFVFDPELFQKQGGDPSRATITQHIITLDGKTISRLVQTTTLQVTLP